MSKVPKGAVVAEAFYPFVENNQGEKAAGEIRPKYAARVAVYDDPLSAPRVVEIPPDDVRPYLEHITETTSRLAREQGGTIPFMVIREVVENLIHAYFEQPTVSIMDNGDTISFSDQGPGIADKDLARQYGTSSATEEMRRYIRGVGSGLPYVEAWLDDHGGVLEIRDNISGGTMVTVSLVRGASANPQVQAQAPESPSPQQPVPAMQAYGQPMYQQVPLQPAYAQPAYAPAGYAQPMYVPPAYGQPAYQQVPMQPMPVPSAAQASQPPTAPTAPAALDQREEQVLGWLASHETVGPSDLVGAFGQSAPTWSRVLNGLESRGLLRKSGQKRVLTDAGRAYVAQGGW